MEVLVLCPYEADPGLISKAKQLAGGSALRVFVPEAEAKEAARYGGGIIHSFSENTLTPDEGALAAFFAEKIRQWGSTIVLAPATVKMRNMMPVIAAKLSAGLTADCTGLSLDEAGRLIQTRPAFGNALMADIRTETSVQLATVRPGTFPPVPCPVTAEYILEQPVSGSRVTELALERYTEGMPLSQANFIVAGGVGIGSREGFEKLEQLAQKLGATVAASRSAVDAGFAPYRCQVGITGVTVCPDVYIAFGISGAVQHLAGMSGAKTVIAVNFDPKAPIFDYADYGIVGDWEAVVDKLLEG